MGNAYASLDLRSPDRVPVLCRVGFVTPPHRAAAGGPPEAEDGRGGTGTSFWEVKCLVVHIVETDHVHNIFQSS